jgi:hypothetical protein
MTIRAASILISLVSPVIFLFGCTSTKYVSIENPSERIVSGCISMLPPAEGEWYVDKHWTEVLYGPDPCEDRLRLASGDEEDLYFIYITTGLRKWSDKLDNEYLRNWVKNYHDRELIKNQELGVKVANYETVTCNGIEGICAEASYNFISSKRLQFKAGGPTTTFRDKELRPSDKYFYEVVEFYVFEGPYDGLDKDRNAFYYEVMFLHVSVDEKKDPELREKAYRVAENIEFNKDWDTEASP